MSEGVAGWAGGGDLRAGGARCVGAGAQAEDVQGPHVHASTTRARSSWADDRRPRASRAGGSSASRARPSTRRTSASLGDRFAFRAHGGPPMVAGQSDLGSLDRAAGHSLRRASTLAWAAESDLNPNRGQGTAQLTAATDQQTLFAQNTPFSSAVRDAMNTPPFEPSIVPAPVVPDAASPAWISAATTIETRRDLRSRSSTRASTLTTPRRRSAELTGAATDAQTWSRVMHFGLNGADVGGGLFRADRRAWTVLMRSRSRSAVSGRAATSALIPHVQRVRRRAAVPAADRRRLARHRHEQAAAGPAHRARAARGCGGESDVDLRARHADDHVERGHRAGVGSGVARCRQRRRGQRPRAADRALGPAWESDAAGEPVRPGACGARAAADRGRGADRQRRDRHGLQDDRGQRARAGQARGAADGRRWGVGASCCPRASPRAT